MIAKVTQDNVAELGQEVWPNLPVLPHPIIIECWEFYWAALGSVHSREAQGSGGNIIMVPMIGLDPCGATRGDGARLFQTGERPQSLGSSNLAA